MFRMDAGMLGARGLAAVMLSLVALGAAAASARADGTLAVSVDGAGSVTGSGIDCTRALHGPQTGICSVPVVGECDPVIHHCLPARALLAATPAPGFAFAEWQGCAALDATCSLLVNGATPVTAVFQDDEWPSVALTQPAAGDRAGTIGLAATASDNVDVTNVAFTVRSVAAGTDTSPPYSASFDTHRLPDGAAAVTAMAYDAAGHITTSTRTITIDNTPPELVVAGPDGQTFGPGETQSWTLTASDATAGLESVRCSVVSGGSPAAFGTCSEGAAGHAVSGLPEGDYAFTVRVTDRAGNTRDRTQSFAIDATPPDTIITSGVAGGATTTATALTWGFAASERASTFRCRVYPAALTPGPFGPCSAPAAHTAAGFAPGTYAFEVVATDPVGNVDPTPAKRIVTVAAPRAPASGGGGGPAPGGGGTAPSWSGASPGGAVLGTTGRRFLVTLAFNYRSRARRTRLTRLVVKHVPAGSTVVAKCRRGCSHASFKRRHAHGTVSLKRLIRRWLKVKTRITVTVSKRGWGSVTKVLVIRRHRSPRVTSRCRPPGAERAGSCG